MKNLALRLIFKIALSTLVYPVAHATLIDKGVIDACIESPGDVDVLRSLLPSQASKLLCRTLGVPENSSSTYLGPNCFTAVQLWFNPNQKLEYVGEILPFLQNFQPIKFEELRLGDVVVFERVDLSEDGNPWYTHAAVYMDRNYVWNKLGPSKYFDHGNGLEFVEPAWTFSTISALQNWFENTEMRFFRKKE